MSTGRMNYDAPWAREYSTSPTGDYLPPKNIGAIVKDTYGRIKDEPSWLGRWADNGWAIRIEPRLDDSAWALYGSRADETWDKEAKEYSSENTMQLLVDLFPQRSLTLVYPTCTYREEHRHPQRTTPVYTVCNAEARHTATRLRDVSGQRVALARCDEHDGLLGA